MTTHYYIYYKVSPEAAERLRAAVEALQRELAEKTGVEGRLLSRRDDPGTWMEIYENVADTRAFDSALARALERVRFAELLGPGSARKTEIFRPL